MPLTFCLWASSCFWITLSCATLNRYGSGHSGLEHSKRVPSMGHGPLGVSQTSVKLFSSTLISQQYGHSFMMAPRRGRIFRREASRLPPHTHIIPHIAGVRHGAPTSSQLTSFAAAPPARVAGSGRPLKTAGDVATFRVPSSPAHQFPSFPVSQPTSFPAHQFASLLVSQSPSPSACPLLSYIPYRSLLAPASTEYRQCSSSASPCRNRASRRYSPELSSILFGARFPWRSERIHMSHLPMNTSIKSLELPLCL